MKSFKFNSVFQNLLFVLLFFQFIRIQAQENFDLQGHRGARGDYPENAVAGFIHAIQCGVQTLELDVVFTKDGQVVVSHEPWISAEICFDSLGKEISSSQEKNFNIYEMTYEQVLKFDCGLKSHPRFPTQIKLPTTKPLLSDLIDTIESYMLKQNLIAVKYNIEIKSYESWDYIFNPGVKEMCDIIWSLVKEKELQNRVIIQSFDFRVLQYFKKELNHPVQLSFLWEKPMRIKNIDKKLRFSPDIYSPNFKLVSKQMIKKIKARNRKIIPWTINNQMIMRKFHLLGCHGLITDFPCLFNNIR